MWGFGSGRTDSKEKVAEVVVSVTVSLAPSALTAVLYSYSVIGSDQRFRRGREGGKEGWGKRMKRRREKGERGRA